MAKLYFRYGAMGSSKTANAIMVQYNYEERGQKVLMLKPKLENRDGAVIVRAGRIVGAGCMLPMSGNVNLSRELGMRHRAGIGASEHTDAVVAIVSEETGSISVAVGGMLKRHLAPETLERLLRNELLPERENDEAASKFKLGNLLRFGKGKKQDGNENS